MRPKPGAGDQAKLYYAEMIPGTKIWIGTGFYLDNIDAYQAQMAGEIERNAKKARSISDQAVHKAGEASAATLAEQSAASETANNIAQASQGIQEVNENVNQCSAVAAENTSNSAAVNQSSTEIANSSDQVKVSGDDLKRMAE